MLGILSLFFGVCARIGGIAFGVGRGGVWVGKRIGPMRIGFDLFRFRR
jgi:hypothetical protein